MTYQGPTVFCRAVAEFSKLPGIGEKTAQRLVLSLVRSKIEFVDSLLQALKAVKTDLLLCSTCFGYSDTEICVVCSEPYRNHNVICVVEDPTDVFAIERSGQFKGVYHVLHGRLAPLDGVGPSDLKIAELLSRLQSICPQEVILATNPDVEGDATALYLAKLLQERKIQVSRIAMGIPMGGHLEYTDQITLGRAILERRPFIF